MKKSFYFSIIFLIIFSCQDSEIIFNQRPNNSDPINNNGNSNNNGNNPNNNVDIEVPDVLTTENSEEDPQQTGVSCSGSLKYQNRTDSGDILDPIEIPVDLPNSYDLSNNMPPVRSQGNQGSCVAWATTYYLKSYQEKIQHNFDYETYEDVMSPAFIYNQIKSDVDCSSGSMIEDALILLSTVGTTSWKTFPYSDLICENTPSDEQIQLASQNKIKEFYLVDIPEDNTDENYTLINLIKTLVSDKNPIIISMDFLNLNFRFENDIYIANTYSSNPIDHCGHAILIVGYDDDLNAFKFVNSWGTSWGNDGYAWLNYNFFEKQDSENFQEGLNKAFVAYDMDE